jgi:acyl-CoA thioester hydrolase
MGASASLTRRLDWAHTDAAGYWHHSTFWTWAEAGEAELARRLGLSDLMFGFTPRKSLSAEFHRPIYFDDEVTITFSVERVGTTSATYRIEVATAEGTAAEGTITAVLVDADGRPTPWPDTAAALLRADESRTVSDTVRDSAGP